MQRRQSLCCSAGEIAVEMNVPGWRFAWGSRAGQAGAQRDSQRRLKSVPNGLECVLGWAQSKVALESDRL